MSHSRAPGPSQASTATLRASTALVVSVNIDWPQAMRSPRPLAARAMAIGEPDTTPDVIGEAGRDGRKRQKW